MQESKFNIQGKIDKLNAAKVELPRLLANTGQTFFQLNFDKQQWDGRHWAPRKEGTWYARKMAGHAILVGRSGDLRRAMQDTIKSADWDKIVWAVKDVPYAKYVNEGTDKMPKREFMGFNEDLLKKVKQKITNEFDKIMKHE